MGNKKIKERVVEMCRVKPGRRVRLEDFDAGWAGDKDVPKEERKEWAEKALSDDVSELAQAQDCLYAADTHSVLILFQAMDAAGKDGTIRHVMSGINPQGCQVFSFKQPSAEELDHNYLWRYMRCLPERGRIGIFNRSYYEEVLVVRVHPELAEKQRIPGLKVDKNFWQERFHEINEFERHLARSGTLILKFFLNVSFEEQRDRFLERLTNKEKHWKFSASDLKERGFWKDYMRAYEEALSNTSTDWAPWFVVPADHKWVTRAIVASAITQAIRGLELQYPSVSKEKYKEIEAARAQLEGEEKGRK